MSGLRLVVVDRSEDKATFALLQKLNQSAYHSPRYDLEAVRACVDRTSADIVFVHLGERADVKLADQLSKLLDVPVIVVTERHDRALESHCVAVGVQDCLHADDFTNEQSINDRLLYAIARVSRRSKPLAETLQRLDKLSGQTAALT